LKKLKKFLKLKLEEIFEGAKFEARGRVTLEGEAILFGFGTQHEDFNFTVNTFVKDCCC